MHLEHSLGLSSFGTIFLSQLLYLFINGKWFELGLGPTKCQTWSGSILFITKSLLILFHAHLVSLRMQAIYA